MLKNRDFTQVDLDKITNLQLREALMKARDDKLAGRPFQRPTFNPYLYSKEQRDVSEVYLVSTTSRTESTSSSKYINVRPESFKIDNKVFVFQINTSTLLASYLLSSMPKDCLLSLNIVQPEDITQFRLAKSDKPEVQQQLIKSTSECLDLYKKLKEETNDTYTLLSVLPLSLSVDLIVSSSAKEWKEWVAKVQAATNEALFCEVNSVALSILHFINSDSTAK